MKRLVIFVVAGALVLAACGDDDGGGVREIGGDECESASAGASGSGSATGSGSAGCPSASASGSEASGSGSATGISEEDVTGETDDPLVLDAVEQYQAYVTEQVDEMIAAARVFTDAVRAGDLEAAKAAYAPSRQSWERIEPIAALIEVIDAAVDARVDDFEGEDDPEFTGWHRLEYMVFELGSLDGAAEFADKLDADLADLQARMPGLELPPASLPVGAAELIEEVSEGKITGEEDRYSGTDLWDFAANVEGSQRLIELLGPAIEARDAELLAAIEAGFADITAALASYKDGAGGYVSYDQLTDDDKASMQAILAGLSENLSLVAGVLGME